MVKTLTADFSLTGNGLRDWLLQRFSAVIITLYFITLCGFFFCHPQLDFISIQTFFRNPWMQIFSLFTLFCLIIHAWIGISMVVTDYVNPFALRFFVQWLVLAALIFYFFWGVIIFLR